MLSDRDGNGKDEVLIGSGPSVGLWVYANDSRWEPNHSLSPERMTAGPLHELKLATGVVGTTSK